MRIISMSKKIIVNPTRVKKIVSDFQNDAFLQNSFCRENT